MPLLLFCFPFAHCYGDSFFPLNTLRLYSFRPFLIKISRSLTMTWIRLHHSVGCSCGLGSKFCAEVQTNCSVQMFHYSIARPTVPKVAFLMLSMKPPSRSV
ncbi:hypothetical protein OG21DRAFT_969092 [Imleria badia]|nr:hypothetical protein OG21DRAFT_969092 [Imleria badia]